MPPASRRTCPGCGHMRTRAEMRDPDAPQVGRPPKYCRMCRESDPEKQEFYASSIRRGSREDCRERQRQYASRTPEQVQADQEEARPDGTKECPEVSGCGRVLPLEAFSPSKWQHDGVHSVCRECVSDARVLV